MKSKIIEEGFVEYIKQTVQTFQNEEIQSLATETLEALSFVIE
jgi:hypothetical protein